MHLKRVSVIGLGYIGLPTAALIASKGIDVIGVDINTKTVATLNQGKIHIVEPDLAGLVSKVVKEQRLVATVEPEPADVFVIAVPTPFTHNYKPDVSYIKSACQAIAPVLELGNLVILESTSPVGTTGKMAHWLAKLRPDLTFPTNDEHACDVNLAYCPERVLPGKVLKELVSNDRIIGGLTEVCSEKSVTFYQQFVEGKCLVTTASTAELAKLTENSYRDVNIAFANELSMVSEHFNVDVWELISLANRHPRVDILQPGAGVGGHCIAVDPWFIVDGAPGLSPLIKTARLVNDQKPLWVIEQLEKELAKFLFSHPEKSLSDVNIACFGLAFKPNIDDLRESPALKITELIAKKYPFNKLLVSEPNISEFPKNSTLTTSKASLVTIDKAVKADVLLVLVAHEEFKKETQLQNSPLNFVWRV